MANPNPSHRNRFQPGHSGNPGGRPKLPDHLKRVKSFSGPEMRATITQFGRMSVDDLQAIVDSNDAEYGAFEIALARLVLKAAKYGNISTISAILDRTTGRLTSEDKGLEDLLDSELEA